MSTIALDLGNTALKYGVFGEAARLRETGTLTDPAALATLWARARPEKVVLATVAAEEATQRWLAALPAAARVLRLQPGITPLPLRLAYATPHTLGADRLAGAVGAAQLRPGQDTLLIDAGTALKLDLVTADGVYHGGSIAPGLDLRLRALHEFTGRLPRLALPAPGAAVQLTGDATASSMLSGVLNGAAAEVRGLVAEYRRRLPGLGLLLTGGDGPRLAAALAPALGPIFVVPELVLIGLDKILRYHVES